MSLTDNAGRVHRPALVASSLTLFVLAIMTLIIRLFIRIRVQKYFGLDDSFLLFATVSLCVATGLLFTFLDKMYLTEALITGLITTLPPDFIEQSTIFHKLSDVCLILLWTTVFGVKFSFLSLFRKLIDRNRPLTIYWKVVTTVNAIVWAYGVAGFIIPCPHFIPPKSLECASGSQLPKTIGLAALLVILDILTDIFIIAIPVNLIWRIRVDMTQKLALALSLCLSVVMIIVTIIRASGLLTKSGNSVDVLWEVYWQYVEASVAIIMASLTAFRSFFVVRSSRVQQAHRATSYSTHLALVKRIFTPRTWRKSSAEQQGFELSDGKLHELPKQPLPDIPRPVMTGMHTFIQGREGSNSANPLSMQSYTQPLEEDDNDPLWTSNGGTHHKAITIQHDLSLRSERASYDTNQPQPHREYV